MNNSTLIKNAFNHAASTYDDHSYIQQYAGKYLIDLVKMHMPDAQYLLDLGCGTGVTTQSLAQRYQYKHFDAIDIADHLLIKAKQRLQSYSINIYDADFNRPYSSPLSFDLIFSNMALHWSNDLSATLAKIHQQLTHDGCLAFSIPLAGTFKELQPNFAIHSFYHLDNINTFLTVNGFHLSAQHITTTTYSFMNIVQALKSIKQVGANHVNQRMHKSLATSSITRRASPCKLTYLLGYFVAQKL